jgi:predicted enzyme related to lactoylglutathione lyase
MPEELTCTVALHSDTMASRATYIGQPTSSAALCGKVASHVESGCPAPTNAARTKFPARRGRTMAQAVVHFEIIGADPAKLREYYGDLFGWTFDIGDAATEEVSARGNYGFVAATTPGGVNGGVGGGSGYAPGVLVYVGVPDVEAALRKAENLGGTRRMGPERSPGGDLVVGRFTDPEGNLIGVAGPA